MEIGIPEDALVVLIGASGSGKSTFAVRHFSATEVVSSDFCRALVCDDEADQRATGDAFEVLHLIVGKRLGRGRLTVVDATNVERAARRPLLALAREFERAAAAVVFALPEAVCQGHNAARPGRCVGPEVVREHCGQLRGSLEGLASEGFGVVAVFTSEEQVNSATVSRQAVEGG